jgi:putative ABC transport system permease protein
MKWFDRPLAWAQLSHSKVRLCVAMGGIAFANVLIFMQLGFLSMFNEGAMSLPEALQGDLFILDAEAKSLNDRGFPRTYLYQAGAIAGVQEIIPFYIRYANWAYDKDLFSNSARIIAYDLRHSVLNLPEVEAQKSKLSMPASFLFDRLSREELAPIAKKLETTSPLPSILDNRRVEAVGLFTIGNSMILGGDGNMLTSQYTYAELFGESALDTVSIGILKLRSNSNIHSIQRGIQSTVPGIQVLTHAELRAKELAYQQTNPTGVIFGFGVVMGFIVGIVVVYQVLYADVSDHLAEYATLKAMGYSDRALLLVIFQESALLAVFGFIPGYAISFWMYALLANLTELPLVMVPNVALMVFCLTLIMCTCSALVASNKLRSADPADIF